jgi:hypothetical protein
LTTPPEEVEPELLLVVDDPLLEVAPLPEPLLVPLVGQLHVPELPLQGSVLEHPPALLDSNSQ